MPRAVAIVAAVALLAAGCGGSGDTNAPDQRRLGRIELGRQATAICARTTGDVADLRKPADPASSRPYLRRLAAAGREQLAQLRRLTPAPAIAARWQRLLAQLTGTYDVVARLGRTTDAQAAAPLLRDLAARQAPLLAAASAVDASPCVA